MHRLLCWILRKIGQRPQVICPADHDLTCKQLIYLVPIFTTPMIIGQIAGAVHHIFFPRPSISRLVNLCCTESRALFLLRILGDTQL